MEANTRHLERIFDPTITYQVPLFQRPYVWNKEENWVYLWDDVQTLLDKHLRGNKVHSHFLGAVVLEQLANPTGSIESRQVIDGQQRFTTLQLFLIAARDLAAAQGNSKFVERFGDLVENGENRIDHEDEKFKLWPTNSDRPAFRIVHEARSAAAVEKAAKLHPEIKSSNILAGYRYFYEQLSEWLSGKLDEDDSEVVAHKSADDRMESLWQVVKGSLQLVVIDLGKDDETQVIFETLNARGTDLLPADLIKNFLFRRASANGDGVEKLYDQYWRRFESDFWREPVQQGRIKRPRIDIFINHYLTLMTRDEVKSSHLFNAFKAFAQDAERPEGSLIPVPTTPAEHIAQLALYSKVFETFYKPGNHARLKVFLQRLEAVDTATVFPLLLHTYAELMPDRQQEFDRILELLEAYLMRRLICNLTPKNYNRFFVDMIRALEKSGAVSAEAVEGQLAKGSGESTRFPTDEELMTAVFEQPLYGRLAVYKVRAVLEALDVHAQSLKSEFQPLPPKLTIEHVMPQEWAQFWPLPSELRTDPLAEQKATVRRNAILNTIGNLTLITGSLNPALSNSAWSVKRPELLKFSKLNLTRYFHGPEANDWDEAAIGKRTEHLFGDILTIWPNIRREAESAIA